MLVHVNDPAALKSLVDSLLRADCSCRRTSDQTIHVAHPTAVDEREARLELSFFLKAWAAQHPRVRLSFVALD
jgi:hypothetical protein